MLVQPSPSVLYRGEVRLLQPTCAVEPVWQSCDVGLKVVYWILWQRRVFTAVQIYKGVCHRKVGPAIKHGSERNFAVPPLLQLLEALRFYAAGWFQMVDGHLFGVHKSTVCRIVSRVSKAIEIECMLLNYCMRSFSSVFVKHTLWIYLHFVRIHHGEHWT